MSSLVLKSLLAGVVACGLLAPSSAIAKIRKGDRAAEVSSARDNKNRKFNLRKHRGKVVVLSFGASWCVPCKKELPAWERLSKKYKKSEVTFVAVNIDNSRDKGKKFFSELGVKNMTTLFDPNKGSVDTYDPPTMPSTFLIDTKGIVREVHAGYRSGDERDLAKLIEKYRK